MRPRFIIRATAEAGIAEAALCYEARSARRGQSFFELSTYASKIADSARLVELLAEYGPSLRLPHSRAFGDGLFELRPRGRAGMGRAFYCFILGKRIVVLHAFIKKTPQTPDRELKLARKRLKELHDG